MAALVAAFVAVPADPQQRAIVANEVEVSPSEASLRLEFSDGEDLSVSFAGGRATVDGEFLGTYEPGGAADREWRDLLARVLPLSSGPLALELERWRPDPGLHGNEHDLLAALDGRFASALAGMAGRGRNERAPDAERGQDLLEAMARSEDKEALARALDDVDLVVLPGGFSHGDYLCTGAMAARAPLMTAVRDHAARRFLEAQIAQAPHVHKLLDGATLVAEPEVERDWSYTSSSFAGDGYVLVGDAACFLDPLFSSGVHLALGGATLAATYVRTALANPASRAQAAQAYHSLYDKQYQYFRLTAQLFYGTNRSADSYFWEARRILGDDDATPRAAFVKVVGGQTPQGYERAVIERGVVPAGLLDEVQRMEAWFQQRKDSTEALLRDPSALLRAVPTLAAQMRLEEKPGLGPQGYTPGFQIVSTGPEAIAGGYPVTAVIATCIAKMNGRRTVAEIIAAVQAEHGLQDGAALTGIVQRDLPTLIGGGMVDVTVQSTGRNEPCPCGSGKKYKRCHGGAGRG